MWTAPLWAYSLDLGTCTAHTQVHALCMYFTYLVSSTTTRYAIAACEVNLLITPEFFLEDAQHGKWSQLLQLLPSLQYVLAGYVIVNNAQLGGTCYRTRLLIFVESIAVARVLPKLEWPKGLYDAPKPLATALEPVTCLQHMKNWAGERGASYVPQKPKTQAGGAKIVGRLFWGQGAPIQSGSKVYCTQRGYVGVWRVVKVFSYTCPAYAF